MFERYTEKARRVIFYARYEASQFGSTDIETDHILLAIFREDKTLTHRLLRSEQTVNAIRDSIERRMARGKPFPTSVDLPLSNPSKRVLAYAAEESERLGHKFISPEHLVLGVVREEHCLAAQLLREHGLTLAEARTAIQEYGITAENLARTAKGQIQPSSSTNTMPSTGMLPLGFPVNTIRVADLQASAAFYGKLSLRVAQETPFEGMVVLSNGPFLFVLYLESLSKNLLCFLVKDIENIASQLTAAGISFERGALLGPANDPSLLLRDPDNNHVCLLSHRFLGWLNS